MTTYRCRLQVSLTSFLERMGFGGAFSGGDWTDVWLFSSSPKVRGFLVVLVFFLPKNLPKKTRLRVQRGFLGIDFMWLNTSKKTTDLSGPGLCWFIILYLAVATFKNCSCMVFFLVLLKAFCVFLGLTHAY